MALIHRITRLFRADMHAVLDKLEEPEVLLQQAIREMDDDLQRDVQQLKLLNQQLHHLTSHIKDLNQSLHSLDEELNICFAAHQEELARTLIKRKLETQRHHKHLLTQQAEMENAVNDLSARIATHQSRLESMRQNADVYRQDHSSAIADDWHATRCIVSDDEVEVAFLKEKQRRSAS